MGEETQGAKAQAGRPRRLEKSREVDSDLDQVVVLGKERAGWSGRILKAENFILFCVAVTKAVLRALANGNAPAGAGIVAGTHLSRVRGTPDPPFFS